LDKEVNSPLDPNHPNKEITWKEQQEKLLKPNENQTQSTILSKVINPPITIPTSHTKVAPSFYQIPAKRLNAKIQNPFKRKIPRTMKLINGMEPYDVLANLDKIQPQISMNQLLAISPKCRSNLSTSLVRKRVKSLEIHEISLDPEAPTVDAIINGSFIYEVQIHSGSSVNLMNFETMEELRLTTMTSTPIILRMVDQSRVKPLGMLNQITTTIGGIDYKIDYIVFKLTESISSYPILLGRPWLYLAKAKDDWGKGTLTIGKGQKKIILPLFPTKYRGETQDEGTSVISKNPTDSDIKTSEEEQTQKINKELPYKSIGMGEYFTPLTNIEDSNDTILAWKNSEVLNISMEPDHSNNSNSKL